MEILPGTASEYTVQTIAGAGTFAVRNGKKWALGSEQGWYVAGNFFVPKDGKLVPNFAVAGGSAPTTDRFAEGWNAAIEAVQGLRKGAYIPS